VILSGDPVGLPGLAALTAGLAAFLLALLVARLRRPAQDPGQGARASRSWLGVAVQAVGIGIGGFGPIDLGLDPLSMEALIEAAAVAILMFGATAIFAWATATMGRNWSLIARTRSDHSLVIAGPFAWVRHPIYSAMGMIGLALAIGFGHLPLLLVGVPVFALGTWLRIREEERLLRQMFGADYDAWETRVKRFIPGLF